MAALNPTSALPLYAQLAEQLLARIRAGDYSVGDRIPSEHALAERYGVGRPTVRQATETLIRRGYLARRRGAGTFVRERGGEVDLFSLGGTLESFSAQGLTLATRLVEPPLRVRVPDESPGHPLAGRDAYRLTRVGSVADEPVLLERIWLDAEVFPDFDTLDLQGRSLSEAVLARYRLESSAADQRFHVRALSGEDAALLGLAAGDAILHVDRTLHFPTATGAVFAQMDCRTDRFTFSQRLGDGGNHGGDHA